MKACKVAVCVAPSDKKLLEAAARNAGLSLSSYLLAPRLMELKGINPFHLVAASAIGAPKAETADGWDFDPRFLQATGGSPQV